MATIRLVPSTSAVSNATYAAIANADNMYTNTDSTTAGTFQHNRASTSNTYYGYLRGFNFGSVPSDATVNSFTVKIKAKATGHTTSTSTNYYMSLYNNTTAISNTTASGRLTTTTTTFTFNKGAMTWNTLKGYGANFGIRIPLRRASSGTADVVSVYGAEILVDYTVPTVVPVTGVSVSPTTATIEEYQTVQLTATVAPSDATNKSVSWSTSNSSVATVSNGLVTAVSAGTANITVTTVDGGFTATCAVTVTPAVTTDYIQSNTMEVGKDYLIVNGNTGTVYMLSNQSGGSRTLLGVQTTVVNGKISIPSAIESKCLFTCELYTPNDDLTTCLSNNGQYLYSDNASGLRMYTTPNNKHWHFKGDVNKLWLFKGTTNGYTDATSEFKYYLNYNAQGNYTDAHVDTTSIEDSTLPAIYLFKVDDGSSDADVYLKQSGNYVLASSVYKKQSGSWVLQTNMSMVFDSGTNYKPG